MTPASGMILDDRWAPFRVGDAAGCDTPKSSTLRGICSLRLLAGRGGLAEGLLDRAKGYRLKGLEREHDLFAAVASSAGQARWPALCRRGSAS